MKYLLASILLFSMNVSAGNFVCNPETYTQKVYDSSINVHNTYKAIMFKAMENWFKKVHGEPEIIEKFDLTVAPNTGIYKDAVDVTFDGTVITKNKIKYSFKYRNHIFVRQGNDPRDNSTMTCGPSPGLPVLFSNIEVFGEEGTKVDSTFLDFFWGSDLCYKYKLEM